jgi:hypothetical protein
MSIVLCELEDFGYSKVRRINYLMLRFFLCFFIFDSFPLFVNKSQSHQGMQNDTIQR